MYTLDVERWPDSLDIVFTARMGDVAWVDLHAVPESIAQAVLLDFDAAGRCCGLEIRDARRVAASQEGRYPRNASPAVLSAPDDGALQEWSRSIACYGGGGDPDVSLHWYSRNAYDYSAELDELTDEADSWLFVGLAPGELLGGLRFLAPRDHLRGLEAKTAS